jgi:hypothetical protein
MSTAASSIRIVGTPTKDSTVPLTIAYAAEGFEPVLLRVIRLFRRLFPMAELGIRELQYDFHIAWRRDNQSSVLHAFLEMLREHAHAEAKDPEKTAAAKHSDRYLHRRSQREVGAAKSDRKATTNGR